MVDTYLTQESWSHIDLEEGGGALVIDSFAVPQQPSIDTVPKRIRVHAGPAPVRVEMSGIVYCDPYVVTDVIRNTSQQAQPISRVAPGAGQAFVLEEQGDAYVIPAAVLNAVSIADAEWERVRRYDIRVYRYRDQSYVDEDGTLVEFVGLHERPVIHAGYGDAHTFRVWRNLDDGLATRYCAYAMTSTISDFSTAADYAFGDRRTYATFRPSIHADGVAEFLVGNDPMTHQSVRVFARCVSGSIVEVWTNREQR